MGPLLDGRALINYSTATLNLMGDGNSFGAGVGTSGGAANWIYAQLAAAAPINGRAAFSNTSVAGQNIRNIIDRAPSYVYPKFVATAGVQNIYSVIEGTNSICNNNAGAGKTALQAIADMTELCTGLKARFPKMRIIAWTVIPRYGLISAWSIVQANAYIQQFNTYLRANYKGMGIDAIADPAALAQFTADPALTTCPNYMQPYMSETGATVHPNNAGYALLAICGGVALRRLTRS